MKGPSGGARRATSFIQPASMFHSFVVKRLSSTPTAGAASQTLRRSATTAALLVTDRRVAAVVAAKRPRGLGDARLFVTYERGPGPSACGLPVYL